MRFPGKTLVVALLLLVVAGSVVYLFEPSDQPSGQIGMAVEFMDHAAAAYVARDKGWYQDRIATYKSYVTGMALASALARRDIQVAYMCLVPAINAYANAGVPIKIVAGTHRYGYALVGNPKVITRVEDLANVRLGCVREGGAVDVLMNRTIDEYHLNRDQILSKVRRMNAPKLLLAIESGQLDAAFMPEQWASMAEDVGFEVMLTAQEVWPGMQGSVLVVKAELIREDPELVSELVAVNERATAWINVHPDEAAAILARVLSDDRVMNQKMMRRSMQRLEFATEITKEEIQEVIEYSLELGYIKRSFPAEEILLQ